ncbi:MAG: phytoene dehydrogenase, partial [Polyangiaceae bacterium]|nr:phytoene dehydrogenase [Polyangiaceae bacterium]
PEVRRVIDDLYVELTRVNAAADAAFDRDVCWPPGTFWERRETNAAAALLPYLRPGGRSLLGEFPANHPFVEVVLQSALFAGHLAPSSRPLPQFAVARTHGSWTRGPFGMAAGEDDIVSFLAERVTALGGQVLFNERAVGVNVGQRDNHEIVLDGLSSVVGSTFVVSDELGESLAQLAHGQGVLRKAQRDWPLVSEKAGRFTVSMLVRREGLPEPLGAEALIFPRMPGAPPDPLSPVVHLQRVDRIATEDDPTARTDVALLVAEIVLPVPGSLPLTSAREAVLNIVLSQLPYMPKHLLVVDSTHDGLPVWTFDNGRRTNVDRIEAQGSLRVPEPMPPLLCVEPPGYLGIGAEPLRGPIPRTFLTGRSVLPSLGQEGEMLACWGVARIITRSDKRRARMRRDMWSRIEFG